MLAEQGDDLASLELPAEEAAASAPQPKQESKPSPPPPAPSSSAPKSAAPSSSSHETPSRVFPSVQRLLQHHGISGNDIKGTGLRGIITKGDVLAHLGLASSPTGTYREPPRELPGFGQSQAKKPEPPKVRHCNCV